MNRELVPKTDQRIRIMLLALFLLPIPFLPGVNLLIGLLSCGLPLIFTGTYRVSRIVETTFETRFYLAFIPFPLKKCKLATVGYVETTYGNASPGMWTFILFGPLQFVMGWVFDYLIPSLGGPYEIWLVTAKGREIIAWQGHNQQYFDANLELLQSQTGAEIRSRTISMS
ncbi:MAG: hypothetical protein JWM11_2148 [Planctomycetaceae bacterium]|nr:hypothetical protein [Planctomycetaceae bacterium]